MFEHIIFSHHDTETRQIFYEVFSDLGYKVNTVLSHHDVLNTFKIERPQYVVLDPKISDVSAEETACKISSLSPETRIIILDPDKDKTLVIQQVVKTIRENYTVQDKATSIGGLKLKANVLIVDDEKESALLLQKHLQRKGYNIDIAFSGEEALAKLKSNTPPEIIFLDIHMPGIDGLVVLKEIKNHSQSTKVIMTSAMEDKAIINEAVRIGADGYLVKPFNLDQLETMIFKSMIKDYL